MHRETLRTLSDPALGVVAGGYVATFVLFGTALSGDPEARPKTNAWTADAAAEYLCNG